MVKKDKPTLAQQMRNGGQRRHFSSGATLYERSGSGESRRLTYLDRASEARSLMSPYLRLPDGLRSVGNFYGASVQLYHLGSHAPFAQERTDGGKHASGGSQLHLVEAYQVALIAQNALEKKPAVRHRQRSRKRQGPHPDIPLRAVVDAICVDGIDMRELALRAGWWADRDGTIVVPNRQSEKLKTALVDGLRTIDEAWLDANIDARAIIGVVEVR